MATETETPLETLTEYLDSQDWEPHQYRAWEHAGNMYLEIDAAAMGPESVQFAAAVMVASLGAYGDYNATATSVSRTPAGDLLSVTLKVTPN